MTGTRSVVFANLVDAAWQRLRLTVFQHAALERAMREAYELGVRDAKRAD